MLPFRLQLSNRLRTRTECPQSRARARYGNEKGIYIAKQLVKTKIEGQNRVLRKYGLRAHDLLGARKRIDKVEAESLVALRRKLTGIEGNATEHYFKHIFRLIPANLRPDRRRAFKAYDGVNNIFNLAMHACHMRAHNKLRKFSTRPWLLIALLTRKNRAHRF